MFDQDSQAASPNSLRSSLCPYPSSGLPLLKIKTTVSSTMSSLTSTKSWGEELLDYEQRLKKRREMEKYAPWHPRMVVLHPSRTFRLAFGLMTDDEMEGIFAHKNPDTMNSKGTTPDGGEGETKKRIRRFLMR